MAKDGIHAIILVFSVRTRFSEEEQATFLTIQALFGHKIVDYMLVVFTGGDDLEANEETLDDYLDSNCPQALQVSYYDKHFPISFLMFTNANCYYDEK